MQGLHIQLLVGLDRNKAHRSAGTRLGNRLRIDVVALVGLDERLNVLRRDQAHLMALFSQRLPEEMRSSARIHANQLNRHVGCEAKQLKTRKLLPYDNFAGLVETNQVKDRLAQIDPDTGAASLAGYKGERGGFPMS
jgi:hypothetical protein